MNLKEQIEAITGQQIPVRYVREVAEAYGLTQNAVIRWLDRVSRVVPIRDVAKGEFTGRPLAFFVTDHRDGFLVQLRELLTNE